MYVSLKRIWNKIAAIINSVTIYQGLGFGLMLNIPNYISYEIKFGLLFKTYIIWDSLQYIKKLTYTILNDFSKKNNH